MGRLAALAIGVLCGCNGIEQSSECLRYLACTEAVTPGSAANYASYADNGACWATDQRSADACSAACAQGLRFLAAGAGQSTPECR